MIGIKVWIFKGEVFDQAQLDRQAENAAQRRGRGSRGGRGGGRRAGGAARRGAAAAAAAPPEGAPEA